MLLEDIWWVLKDGFFILSGRTKSQRFVLGKGKSKEEVLTKARKQEVFRAGLSYWQGKHARILPENALTLIK